jgi:hypothetical protein
MNTFYASLRTDEGEIIQVFARLSAWYGRHLRDKLDRAGIPLDTNKILTDKNARKRFIDFYNDEVRKHECNAH